MRPLLREARILSGIHPVAPFEGVVRRPNTAASGTPLSVWQDEANYFVEADLPGVAESDLEITVHQERLLIRGEKKPVEGREYLFNSRPFGKFERQVVLPEKVQADAVRAELNAGVLRVTLPKRVEAQPKKISVQTS